MAEIRLPVHVGERITEMRCGEWVMESSEPLATVRDATEGIVALCERDEDAEALRDALNAMAPAQALDPAALSDLYWDARLAARQAILAARPPVTKPMSPIEVDTRAEDERNQTHRAALLAVYEAGRRGMRNDG